MRQKKNFFYICLAEILFLMAIVIVGIFHVKTNPKVEASLTQWESDYITYNDGWYIDEESVQVSDKIIFLQGPHMKLPKGNYTIRIRYECEDNQSFEPYAEAYIRAGNVTLSKNQTSATYKIIAEEDLDDFEIYVYYSGIGYFAIEDITIEKNTFGIRKQFTLFFFLFLFLDSYLMFSHVIKKYKNFLLILTGIIALASMPLFVGGIIQGHDLKFHLMRIEAIAKELLHGNIPVKLSSLYMDGYGYPVSVYYGDLLLYIPAFFRLMGFSVVASYKIYIFLINIGTTISSYACFGKILKDKRITLIVCLAYTTSYYRMMDIYVRAAVGEYSAMMFLPLVVYAVYQIYTESESRWKNYRKYALLLALGMTGLIGTHILTVEMVVVAMLLFCIVLWKKTLQKKTVWLYTLAIIQTFIFNLYYIVPFLDYYRNVDVNISNSASKYSAHIQWKGAYIGDYFSFFKELFGWNSINANERMALTPGMVLMLVLVFACMLWINGKAGKEMKILTVFSITFLFMASNLFPWDHLAANYKWGNILAQIQFPWRYIELAVVFLVLLLGTVLKTIKEEKAEYRKMVYSGTIIMSILSVFFFLSSYNNPIIAERFGNINYYDTAELETYSTGTMYLRTGTDTGLFTGEIMQDHMRIVGPVSRNGTHMEFYCESSEADGFIEVPVLNYKGYQATDEYGTKYEITDGENNVIKVRIPAGFRGNIAIDFVQPWYWRAAESISLIAGLFLCIFFLRKKKKKLKRTIQYSLPGSNV